MKESSACTAPAFPQLTCLPCPRATKAFKLTLARILLTKASQLRSVCSLLQKHHLRLSLSPFCASGEKELATVTETSVCTEKLSQRCCQTRSELIFFKKIGMKGKGGEQTAEVERWNQEMLPFTGDGRRYLLQVMASGNPAREVGSGFELLRNHTCRSAEVVIYLALSKGLCLDHNTPLHSHQRSSLNTF